MNFKSFSQASSNSLDVAGRMIEKYILSDNCAPSLIELAGISEQSGPTASGLTDNDYPNLSTFSKGFANITQLKTLSKVPLPPEIMEHFNHMQCHCMMGLFTEINRAWLTIDSDIYVWSYEHGSDVAYYDGLSETIISVGLVEPKTDIFHKYITHLLVLTTTVEIIVLGVTFTPTGQQDEMHLVSEPVFVIPTDGVGITAITGTSLGRIFLGGRDGSLFEISYQAEESWFGKRCKKVNHSTGVLSFLIPSFLNVAFNEEDPISKISVDNSRNILYTLTEKGSIEVFDLGESGLSTTRIIKLSQSSIVQSALNIVKTLDSPNFRPIVSISAIESGESSLLHLVAVSQSGVRFYFTTSSLIANIPNQRPSRLQLLHVRMPPGFSANALALKPKMVHLALYRKNTVFMVTSPTSDQDHLWCLSADPFPFFPFLMEAYTVIPLDGPAWAMAEVHQSPSNTISGNLRITYQFQEYQDPPLVVRQHIEPPRKIIVLTAQGAQIVTKLRPVDFLRQLLIDNNGPENEAVKMYFQIQREDQACATCLILACLENVQNSQLSEWATRAFFLYGGEPKILTPVQVTSPNPYMGQNMTFNPSLVSTPVQHYSPDLNKTPMGIQQQSFSVMSPQNLPFQTNPNQTEGGLQISFSPRHNGLYLYIGRILRPLWNTCCVQKVIDSGSEFLFSTVSAEDCMWVLSYLKSLKNFLDKNTQLAINSNLQLARQQDNTTLNASNVRINPSLLKDVQLEERQSLDSLKIFTAYACEVIGLWKILCEHQFNTIIDLLSKDHQNMLHGATFRDLILNGYEIIQQLIVNLINSYFNDNASIDFISSKLRDVCPNLYKVEDAACSKANEILLVSKNKQNVYEKEEMLQSALKLCKDVAPNLNLPAVCQKFAANQFYKGLIDLCVTCARKIDDKNIGSHYYKSNEPTADQDGYQAYAKRMDCYKEITNALENLCEQSLSTAYKQDNTMNITMDCSNVNSNEAYKKVSELIQDSLRYDDELLHVAIYDWMLGKQMYSELITICESSLETYLIRATQQCPDAVQVYDLLWKYYEQNNNHAAAAKVLNTLASESSNSISLAQRIEYLARSVICMRSDNVGCAAPLGVFLREIEDRIQIARVQQKILEGISNLQGRHPRAESAITDLNSKLYDVTELYEEFAEPYDLWECKLAIIHCSGHDDTILIQTIWRNIILSEIRQCHGSPNDKMTQLLNKMKILHREYGDSKHCFPLMTIINELETQCCVLEADSSLVPSALIAMNISMKLLIETYNLLVKENIAGSEGNRFHMFESVAYLIKVFTENQNLVSFAERLLVKTKAQDIISGALSSLYSKPNTEDLIQILRNIQARLNRL